LRYFPYTFFINGLFVNFHAHGTWAIKYCIFAESTLAILDFTNNRANDISMYQHQKYASNMFISFTGTSLLNHQDLLLKLRRKRKMFEEMASTGFEVLALFFVIIMAFILVLDYSVSSGRR